MDLKPGDVVKAKDDGGGNTEYWVADVVYFIVGNGGDAWTGTRGEVEKWVERLGRHEIIREGQQQKRTPA